MKYHQYLIVMALCSILAIAGLNLCWAGQGQPPDHKLSLEDFQRSAHIIFPYQDASAAQPEETGETDRPEDGLAYRDDQGTGKDGGLQEGVLYRLTLPPRVALESLRQDGRDLCVFNAQGEALPFSISVPEKKRSLTVHELEAMFPLWGKAKGQTEEYAFSFKLDNEGRLVPRVTGMSDPHQVPAGQELKGYIIPLPEAGIQISTMRFEWDRGKDNTVQFSLQTGDDLKNWQTLQSRASLVRFDGPDGVLESSHLTLNGIEAGKYLRIIFDAGLAPERIRKIFVEQWSSTRIRGQYGPIQANFVPYVPETVEKVEISRRGKRETREVRRPPVAAGLEYLLASPQGDPTDARGALNLESIRFQSSEPGQYASVRVLTRRDSEESWRYAGDYVYFGIIRAGEMIHSQPFTFNGQAIGQIRLESLRPERELPKVLPLVAEYYPQELIFLAQGSGPYTVAWKSPKGASQDATGIRFLIGQGADVYPAVLGDVQSMPMAEAVAALDGSSPEGWLRYLLWLVLGAGVVFLGMISLPLVRAIRRG